MRKSVLAFCGPVAAVFATPAMAATTNLGVIASGASVNSGAFWFGGAPQSDSYTFQIAAGDNSSFSFSRINFGLADFAASLFRGGSLVQSFGTLANGASQTTSLGMLGGGSYTLSLAGTPSQVFYGSTIGGGYAITLASTAAAPVPGPAGWLVAGAGFALIGFRYRRVRVAKAKLAMA